MIQLIWRILVVLAGLCVIAAATHANVEHAGGYTHQDAWLIIAIAALLALGMGYAAMEWQQGRYVGAIALVACLLCGEAYWLGINLEREIAAREAKAAPLLAKRAKREAAEKRLVDATKARRLADEAMISEAAKRGCARNCARLLLETKKRADAEWNTAREALSALPLLPTVAPLPERLGIAAWQWDMLIAILRSIGVIGGSIAVALAIHPKRGGYGPARRWAHHGAQPRKLSVDEVSPLPFALISSQDEASRREHVAAFLRAVLRPDPEGSTSLRRLHSTYMSWCDSQNAKPLPPAQLGHELRSIVDTIGLEVEPEGQDILVKGAALAA